MRNTLNAGRRRFLGAVVAALAGLPARSSRVGSGFVSAVQNQKSARAIGRAYLSTQQDVPSIDALIAAICDGHSSLLAQCDRGDTKAVRNTLALKQRQDFEQGRVVRLHGWVLSATEIQLCSLVALAAQRPI